MLTDSQIMTAWDVYTRQGFLSKYIYVPLPWQDRYYHIAYARWIGADYLSMLEKIDAVLCGCEPGERAVIDTQKNEKYKTFKRLLLALSKNYGIHLSRFFRYARYKNQRKQTISAKAVLKAAKNFLEKA